MAPKWRKFGGKKNTCDIYRNECSSTCRSLPNITFFKRSVLLPHQLGLL